MPGSSGMLALGMFKKDRDMKRVKKADGGMMTAQVMPAPMPNPSAGGATAQVMPAPMPNPVAVNAPRATFGGGMGPNAPEGRGYNREGFKGRGPMATRPGMDRGMAVGGGPAPVVSMGPGTGIGGSMPRSGGAVTARPLGPAPVTPSGGAVTARPLGPAPVTATVGFKKGGMVSKGKHSSVTPAGGRAGGKTKPCKIY